MSSFKPIDGSKEDFRKYLDRKGVLDAITKVLIKCNSDRPENAIEYLLDNLGERLKDKDTIARLENELNDARNEVEVLKREISALKLNASPSSAEANSSSTGTLQEEAAEGNAVDSAGGLVGASSVEPEKPSNKSDTAKEPTEDAAATAVKAEVPESDPKESVQ